MIVKLAGNLIQQKKQDEKLITLKFVVLPLIIGGKPKMHAASMYFLISSRIISTPSGSCSTSECMW